MLGLTQQVRAELGLEPRSAGSQPFSHWALPLPCHAEEQLTVRMKKTREGSGFGSALWRNGTPREVGAYLLPPTFFPGDPAPPAGVVS